MTKFLVKSSNDPQLHWSNQDGWVDKNSANVFTKEEAETLPAPMGGVWVEEQDAVLYWVALYKVDRAFGGPEEGGWYYSTGELVLDYRIYRQLGLYPICLPVLEEAQAHRESMSAMIEHRGLNEGKHEPSSLLSEGEWLVAEIHEEMLPIFYPETRPHYE